MSMKNLPTFDEFINEGKTPVYNLGMSNDAYVIAIFNKLLPTLKDAFPGEYTDYHYGYVNSSSDNVLIKLKGKVDYASKIKSALKGFDPNLDLSHIQSNLNMDDKYRSKNDIEQDIYSWNIPKIIDYWKGVKNNYWSNASNATVFTTGIALELINMMGQYTSDADELADIEWNDLSSFLKSAEDYLSTKDMKTFLNDVKSKYPKLK